jgi:ATP-binding cassette subfamily F protein 3
MHLSLASERGSRKVVELSGLWKQFGDHVVLGGVDLLIWAGERVALIGPNGAGKSVLFRTILGEEQPTDGTTKLGPSVDVAYYSQEHETLDYESTPVDEIRRVSTMREDDAFAFLGSFLFDHQKAQRKVRLLSGGEKSRLQMARLMLMRGNLLLLDEPTNNLDIASAEVLEEAIERYEGTVFVISHDRYFLERMTDRILELEDGELTEYFGGYAAYRDRKRAAAERASAG